MTAAVSPTELAGLIDHTLLKADADLASIQQVIDEAVQHQFASVCITPRWVRHTAMALKGTGVATCTVIGFPLGANTTANKVAEATEVVQLGADEVDMVVDIAAANAGEREEVTEQIAAVAAAAHAGGATVKVILETALLSQEAKELVCLAALAAGADFVKTSTGFASAGATVEDIALMHRLVGGRLGIKASGGVRSYDNAAALVSAGATRLGASASLGIVGAEHQHEDTAY